MRVKCSITNYMKGSFLSIEIVDVYLMSLEELSTMSIKLLI